MFLGTSCVACGRTGSALCDPCLARLRVAPPVAPPDGVGSCVALLAYEGVARDLVVALKYRNARALVDRAGRALAAAAGCSPGAPFALVTWAPTAGRRRRLRGYDQAQLLAQALARAAGLPVRPLLRRVPGPPQTGRTRSERLEGPRFRPLPAAATLAPDLSILVVDDVLTTGATLRSAALALRAAAPVSVHAAVLARADRRDASHSPSRGKSLKVTTLRTENRNQ